jgi:1-acyl-sn-glycerol-3-phosphate acyltransferase
MPEGTRSPNGRLQPLKKGPFHLALATQATIIPIKSSGLFEIHPVNSLKLVPGIARFDVLPAIDTVGKTLEELQATVQHALS